MLQAIHHNKVGKAIPTGSFSGKEDTLTASVVGRLQYLPEDTFWSIIRGACGRLTVGLPESIGEVLDFRFWERLNATGTKNERDVEPDVWVVTNLFDIIIEAKRSDCSADNSQYEDQWRNQVIALQNTYGKEEPKPLIYIAIGGNDSLRDTTVQIKEKEFIIHTASWYNLLNTVLNELNDIEGEGLPNHTKRVLQDIVLALQIHRIIKTIWFDTLPKILIPEGSVSALYELWDFDNTELLETIPPIIINEKNDLQSIWTVAK